MATQDETVELQVMAEPSGVASVVVEQSNLRNAFITLNNNQERGWCEGFRVIGAVRQALDEHIAPKLGAEADKLDQEVQVAISFGDIVDTKYRLEFSRRCDILERYIEYIPLFLGKVQTAMDEAMNEAMAEEKGDDKLKGEREQEGESPSIETTKNQAKYIVGSLSDQLADQIDEARETKTDVLKFQSMLGTTLRNIRLELSEKLVSRVHVLLTQFLTKFRTESRDRLIGKTCCVWGAISRRGWASAGS